MILPAFFSVGSPLPGSSGLKTTSAQIDVSGGDKVPRKGGPGISQSDLLIVNKIDLAPHVGASLDVMKRDSAMMREGGPTIFASIRHGEGVEEIRDAILGAWNVSGARGKSGKGKAKAA